MKAHITQNGFYVRSTDDDYIETEGTFAPLPKYNPKTQIPKFNGTSWDIVSIEERNNYKPPSPDMASLRAQAIKTAMEYGNRITQKEMGHWAGIEPYSWSQQKEEATLFLRDGATLGDYDLLPTLAADKGVSLEEYAEDVMQNAIKYQEILRAAVNLRRLAVSALSNPELDTPEKLEKAVADLTIIADTIAMKLIG